MPERLYAKLKEILGESTNDPDYDRYSCLISRVLNVPICGIGILDTDSIWLKSFTGISVRTISNKLLKYHENNREIFVVLDVENEENIELKQILHLLSPSIQFFASVSIMLENIVIGFVFVANVQQVSSFPLNDRINFIDLSHSVSILIRDKFSTTQNKESLQSLQFTLQDLSVPLLDAISQGKLSRTESIDNLEIENDKTSEVHEDLRLLTIRNLKIIEKKLQSRALYDFIEDDDGDEDRNDDDDKDQRNNDNKSRTSHSSGGSYSASDPQLYGQYIKCNIFRVIEQSKNIIAKMNANTNLSSSITWTIDRTYLDCGIHVTYPDIAMYVMTSAVSYLSSFWVNIRVFVGLFT